MILNTASLTQYLKQVHHNQFFVQVLTQKWAIPTPSDRLLLNCKNQQAQCREVLLFGSGTPVVYARSLLPESSLTDCSKAFLELGNKPLGELIFSQPGWHRSAIEFTHLPAINFSAYLNIPCFGHTVWARRSLLYLHSKPILVYEAFLPTIKTQTFNAASA